ncbi:hypothetical protein GCK72_019471 [Caenorhabditis remanei]|uniref:Serpentine Receptor, class I n=1 Tax=Caenorhabditis remanei TaxID=31234 RepID=A0A6A5GDW2_CAERE|nr:hypothetical protein GCK72_019471 [Caenorhabditis remanei]KAF1752916.1 hypothetical protein GCK72_019471 [Caenorhabditis remanei]
MDTIDFFQPKWLLRYYDVIGVCSLVLNSLGLYLLLFETLKLGRFRYYLMLLQISCALTDVHLTFLMKPVTLCPFLAVYTVGALSTYFNISAHICVIMVGFFALIQLESLIFCFAKKHQALAFVLRIHILPNIMLYFYYLMCIICPFVLCGVLHHLYIPTEQQLDYIEKNFPETLPGFLSLSHFVLYIKSDNLTGFYFCLFIGGFGLCSLFLFFIIDMLGLMKDLKLRLSTATYQKHHEAIQSLMVQFFTSLMCIGPPCILLVIVFMELNHGQLASQILIAWFTSHSSVNMVCLCLFFPPYRRFFLAKSKKNKEQIVRVVASSIIARHN